jgi:osmotically inducible lipoprotein OsmB
MNGVEMSRIISGLVGASVAALMLAGCTTTGERLSGAGVGAVGGGAVAGPVGAVVGGVGGAVAGPTVAHAAGIPHHRSAARRHYVRPRPTPENE